MRGRLNAKLRVRSLGGCGTCRNRRLKCDEKRPFCDTCQRNGLDCLGYESRIQFVQDGRIAADDSNNNGACRRPLTTETAQQIMSNSLLESIQREPLDGVLAKLDDQSSLLQPSSDSTVSCGPFAAFKLRSQPQLTEQGLTEQAPLSYFAPNCPFEVNLMEHPLCLSLYDYEFESQLANAENITDLQLETLRSEATLFESLNNQFPLFQPQRSTMSEELDDEFQQTAPMDILPRGLSLTPPTQSLVPHDAVFLLEHYRDHVIRLLSPLKYHRKTPWNILHLPCAMNTLAQLVMGSPANHARTALFYSILSVSAFNLRGLQSSPSHKYWDGIGDKYKKQAQKFLKMCLKTEIDGPKRAKYKEILMSILSMVTISVFDGKCENSQFYLMDAERLIRQRGLPKIHKSRKIRLLHHCYAYLRIFQESTLVPADVTGAEDPIPKVVDKRSQPRATFRVSYWHLDPKIKMTEAKDVEVGQNDIHLEVPGRWDSTLYPEIYGIPESFMLLLSQVTRLGNEREIVQRHPENEAFIWRNFSQRAKSIEKQVCAWTPPSPNYPDGHDESVEPGLVDTNRRIIDYLLLAMHQALIIYFYRRVYDVEPGILQPNVEKAKDYLLKIQDENTRSGEYTVGIVWPGFIAACEALTPKLQKELLAWFTTSISNSNLPTFESAKTVVTSIWAARQEAGDSGDASISWIDYLRTHQLTLLCT